MATQTASNRMTGLVDLYDLHTTYFSRAIEGISDEDAHKRLDTKAIHVAWLAGSLVQQRFDLAKELSADKDAFSEKQEAHELFSDYKGIIDNATYPSLVRFEVDWLRISPQLKTSLSEVNDAKLDTKIDMGGESMGLYELLSFSIYREANMIGQIALWRRLLGYPALRYM